PNNSFVKIGSRATLARSSEEKARLAGRLTERARREFFYTACALAGEASDAVEQIALSLRSYRSTGASISISYFSSALGKANARLGRLDEAWRCIAEATAELEATGERWHEADIHRTAGEIALMSSEPDSTKAQAYFERALEIARRQRTRSWEL